MFSFLKRKAKDLAKSNEAKEKQETKVRRDIPYAEEAKRHKPKLWGHGKRTKAAVRSRRKMQRKSRQVNRAC